MGFGAFHGFEKMGGLLSFVSEVQVGQGCL